jgi:hypothetical protein
VSKYGEIEAARKPLKSLVAETEKPRRRQKLRRQLKRKEKKCEKHLPQISHQSKGIELWDKVKGLHTLTIHP